MSTLFSLIAAANKDKSYTIHTLPWHSLEGCTKSRCPHVHFCLTCIPTLLRVCMYTYIRTLCHAWMIVMHVRIMTTVIHVITCVVQWVLLHVPFLSPLPPLSGVKMLLFLWNQGVLLVLISFLLLPSLLLALSFATLLTWNSLITGFRAYLSLPVHFCLQFTMTYVRQFQSQCSVRSHAYHWISLGGESPFIFKYMYHSR